MARSRSRSAPEVEETPSSAAFLADPVVPLRTRGAAVEDELPRCGFLHNLVRPRAVLTEDHLYGTRNDWTRAIPPAKRVRPRPACRPGGMRAKRLLRSVRIRQPSCGYPHPSCLGRHPERCTRPPTVPLMLRNIDEISLTSPARQRRALAPAPRSSRLDPARHPCQGPRPRATTCHAHRHPDQMPQP